MALPGRLLAVAAALFLASAAGRAPLYAQDEEQAAEQSSEEGGEEGGSTEDSAPVIENAPVDGQALPARSEEAPSEGEDASGGGEVIAVGEEPRDTGPDSGGLVEEAPPKPRRLARAPRKSERKAKAHRKSRRAAQAAAAEEALEESKSTALIPAARLSLEPVKPVEPLPPIALSPIAPYNP